MGPAAGFDLDARRHWARRQGHPDYLWPEVAIVAWRNALGEVERALAAVLAGQQAELRTDGTTVEALGIAALTSGTGPLLGLWIERCRIEAAADVSDRFALHLAHGRRRWQRAARRLSELLAAFDRKGVPSTVLKGMHTAAYFPEPGARPAADIDLAVPVGSIEAAERVLASLAYVPGRARTLPWRREWRYPDERVVSMTITHEDNPMPVEVHGGLDRDLFGVRTIPFSAAARLRRLDGIGGFTSTHGTVLEQPLLWIYLAVHASEELHRLQLLRLVELVLVARRDLTTPSHWAAVRDLGTELGALRFLYPAAALAARLAPDAIDPGTLAACAADAPPRMRRFVEGLRPSDAQRFDGLSLGERFLWPKGVGETMRRAAYLVWPSRSRTIGTVYAERLWRVLRGRVSIGSR